MKKPSICKLTSLSFSLLLGSLTTVLCFTSEATAAQVTKIVTRKFTWNLKQNGDVNAQAISANFGPAGNADSDSDNLLGSFKISAIHTPPNNFIQRLDELPEETVLNFVANFTGELSNSCFLDIPIVDDDCFTKANASITAPQNFNFQEVKSEFVGTTPINQNFPLAINVTDGQLVPYSGSVSVETLFGIGIEDLDFVTALANLNVQGSLQGPTMLDIRYEVPVPEPLTILGSATALGFGALLKRESSKKKNKS